MKERAKERMKKSADKWLISCLVIIALLFLFAGLIVLTGLTGFVTASNHTNGSTSSSSSSSSSSSTSVSVPAPANADEAIGNAYQCLDDLVKDKKTSELSLQEAIFSTLALGSKNNLLDKIKTEEKDDCWPKAGCTIKDTAQVLLAYDRAGKSTADIEKWLLSKNSSASELDWFLEIDISNHVPAECTIKYDTTERKINIDNEMKITNDAGSCLPVSGSGYWLNIRDSCIGKKFTISCSEDFVTTLLYQKKATETIYVSSETSSAASSGTTEEQVKAKCFKTGNTCDYEGSLWAALALEKAGKDISDFVPYLLALASDNQRYLPSSLLYSLTGADDQYSSLIQSQKQNKFWQASSTPYNKFYDTALGMLALQGTGAAELSNAQNYLLSIQTPEGCWNNNNIRDTAFLLYSGWPKSVGSPDGAGSTLCTEAGYSCESGFACTEARGNILYEFECTGSKLCCSIKLEQQSCAEQNGILCTASQQCEGTSVSSSEGSCCLGTCEEVIEDTCETFGGSCRTSCEDDETESSELCTTAGTVCCELKTQAKGSSLWLWITLLVILIIAVVAGIFYRDKLKMLLFRFRKGRGTGSTTPANKPSFPPSAGIALTRPLQRPFSRFAPAATQAARSIRPNIRPNIRPALASRKPVSKADQEMEETLKKLKEMSK